MKTSSEDRKNRFIGRANPDWKGFRQGFTTACSPAVLPVRGFALAGPAPVPGALEQGVGPPSLLLLPSAGKGSLSLLVPGLENLQQDGGWQRAALLGNPSRLGLRNAHQGLVCSVTF